MFRNWRLLLNCSLLGSKLTWTIYVYTRKQTHVNRRSFRCSNIYFHVNKCMYFEIRVHDCFLFWSYKKTRHIVYATNKLGSGTFTLCKKQPDATTTTNTFIRRYALHMLLVLTKNKNYVTYIWNKHENFRKNNNALIYFLSSLHGKCIWKDSW